MNFYMYAAIMILIPAIMFYLSRHFENINLRSNPSDIWKNFPEAFLKSESLIGICDLTSGLASKMTIKNMDGDIVAEVAYGSLCNEMKIEILTPYLKEFAQITNQLENNLHKDVLKFATNNVEIIRLSNSLKISDSSYNIAGFGTVTVKGDVKSTLQHNFEIIHDSEQIGMLVDLSPKVALAHCHGIALNKNLPIEVRVSILALEISRFYYSGASSVPA